MKRIAVCMDGTWQKLSQARATNIAIIARSIAHSVEANGPTGQERTQQIVVYSRGVGAVNEVESEGSGLAGGLFGAGLEDTILDTYTRIAFNYEPEDELYIFGFSRGAFSARSLAGMIAKVGIVSRRYVEAAPTAFHLYRNRKATAKEVEEFRQTFGKKDRRRGAESYYPTTIRYLGVFDTVGQRGMPSAFGPVSDWLNRKYAFHDTALNAAVERARHALAIDEDRWTFPPSPWTNFEELNEAYGADPGCGDAPYQQRWFPGGHGDIGGGSPAPEVSGYPLRWIVDGAEQAGLRFDYGKHSPLAAALENLDPVAPLSLPRWWRRVHPINWSFTKRQMAARGLPGRPSAEAALKIVHPVTAVRVGGSPRYRPPALRRFHAALRGAAAGVEAVRAAARFIGTPRP